MAIDPGRKLDDGRTAYSVRWGWKRPEDGKTQDTVYSLKDARLLDARMKVARREEGGVAINGGKVTFDEVAQIWLANRRPSSRVAAQVHLRLHILPTLGHKPIGRITTTDIETCMGTWSHLAQNTRAAIFGTMNTIFLRAIDDRRIAHNPCAGQSLTRPQPHRLDLDPWPRADVLGVCSTFAARFALLPYWAAECGMRQGEAFAVADQDLDLSAGRWGQVRIVRQVKLDAHGQLWYSPPKHRTEEQATLKPRTVPLTRRMREALDKHLADVEPFPVRLPWDPNIGRVEADTAVRRTYKLLTVTRQSGALNRNYFNTRLWKPTLAALGIPTDNHHGLHALRHYYAATLADQGIDLGRIAYLLGHKDEAFTVKIYRRFTKASMVDVADALDALDALDGGE